MRQSLVIGYEVPGPTVIELLDNGFNVTLASAGRASIHDKAVEDDGFR